MANSRESLLQEFVDWTKEHIRGDEKGEAQIFLDHLFRAFGQKGSLDVGGTPELRIRKASEDGGGTAFADYVWKPIVVIEMKKRGADLAKHFRQAFDYWVRLVPNRPQYVVLCNFDEFWVYDFNNQIDSPKDKVKLVDLATGWGPLAFLFPTKEQPTFGNDREKVTREAADRLALCFKKLITRKVDRDLAQRFILQTLVALFAEDIGLLPRYLFATLVAECKEPADSYDKIGGLFEAMNNPVSPTGGRYKGVRYFNGGIFAKPARLELYEDELNQLGGDTGSMKGAAASDWSKVSPEIFGAIFQDSMDAEERHAYGAHYTSPVDIMKIVKPTISDPWTQAIEAAKSSKKLNDLLERLTTLRVLDPACGSGNFLYLAYREMKRLETKIRERLKAEFPNEQPALIHVNARQFFGIDINPFAVELAKVTLMIGRKLALEELHIADEKDLPLDNLDQNFCAQDALITATDGEGAIQTVWPPADIIVGNPPYLGSRYLAQEHGYTYARKLYALYPEVPKMADYCVYWFRRSHDHLPSSSKADPFSGRAGLVGTNNVRTGATREAGLDYIVANQGTIYEAVSTQPWSGEAAVLVSIVNWIKGPGEIPRLKKLTTQSGAESTPDFRVEEVPSISSSLRSTTDVSQARKIAANSMPKVCYVGQYPFNEGFWLSPADAEKICKVGRHRDVIFPYMIGADLLVDGRPSRWIIDFGKRDMLEASAYPDAFEHVKRLVMPTVLEKAKKEIAATGKESTRWSRLAQRWWQLRDYQPGTMAAIASVPRYVACSRVTKRPIFAFVSPMIHPDNTITVFSLPDDYSFGVLHSHPHWVWFEARCSTLGGTFRYTGETVFDTFPWPQSPTKRQIDAVASAAVALRHVRAAALKQIDGGLRALYRTLELPGKNPLKDAHAALDSAVLAAYGFDPKKDLLAQLLALNLAIAEGEKAGEPVTPPGVPPIYGDPARLMTEDCIHST